MHRMERNAREEQGQAALPPEQREEARVGQRGRRRARPPTARGRPGAKTDSTIAAAKTGTMAALTRWDRLRFRLPMPVRPDAMSRVHGTARPKRSVRNMPGSVHSFRCLQRRSGTRTIRAAARRQAKSEVHVLDVLPFGTEAPGRREGVASDRAETGPEGRRVAARLLVHVVVEEIAIPADAGLPGRSVVVGAEQRDQPRLALQKGRGCGPRHPGG